MLRSMVMACRLHVCDILDEMSVMVSRGQVKSLYKCLH